MSPVKKIVVERVVSWRIFDQRKTYAQIAM
jgi:hypothetical protein